jgi:hypothetical protein
MKKLVKVIGLLAVLLALPVAFSGGASQQAPGIRVTSACAQGDDGPCLFALGSVCRDGPEERINSRRDYDE